MSHVRYVRQIQIGKTDHVSIQSSIHSIHTSIHAPIHPLTDQALKQHMAEIIQTGASDSHQDHAQLQELTSDPAVMFSDKTVSMNDKLIRFATALDGWFRNEPTKILSTPQPLRVSDHASFGQLKATLLTSCTCSVTTGAATSQAQSACMFHCSDPDLKDVLYQVCRCVHSTFSDSWACFVNIFLESCVSGKGWTWTWTWTGLLYSSIFFFFHMLLFHKHQLQHVRVVKGLDSDSNRHACYQSHN